jgi:hypothetical protein
LLMFCWLALNFEPPYLCLPSSWITGVSHRAWLHLSFLHHETFQNSSSFLKYILLSRVILLWNRTVKFLAPTCCSVAVNKLFLPCLCSPYFWWPLFYSQLLRDQHFKISHMKCGYLPSWA